MSKINIDSRGCGAGKTRNTIIPRIKDNLRRGIKSLVVVPSHKLQEDYAQLLGFACVITSKNNSEAVNSQLYKALEDEENVIVLSHEAFLNCTQISSSDRFTRDLIIDEAFDPVNMVELNLLDSASRQYFVFDGVFSWKDPLVYTIDKPTTKVQPWFELDVVKSTPPSLLRDSATWRKIVNPNIRLWATWQTGDTLMNNPKQTAQLILEVNPSILDGWHSIWIAAAAFEQTMMYYWITSNNIQTEVVYPFETHKLPLHMHIPVEEFTWSLSAKKKFPNVVEWLRLYVDYVSESNVLFVDNNSSFGLRGLAHQPIRLKHNAHGINDYKHLHDFAYLSAIRPNNYLKSFYAQQYGLSGSALGMAFSGYDCYQLMMRTALRDPTNTKPVNVYLLDTQVALAILDLFDPNAYEVHTEIDVNQYVKQEPKKVALSNAERARRYRAKQKQLKEESRNSITS